MHTADPVQKFDSTDAAFLIAALGAAAGIIFLLTDALVDDAFIYLRVVDRLWNGQGWSYNPGERVNACSSLLYPLLLLALRTLGWDGPQLLKVAQALGVLLAALALYWPQRRFSRPLAFAVGLLPLVEPRLLAAAGLETGMLVAAVALSIAAFGSGRLWLAGAAAGLAALLRLDALALPFVFIAWVLVNDRRLEWRPLAGAALVVGTAAALAHSYFGAVLPQSVAAKIAQSNPLWSAHTSWLLAWAQNLFLPWLTLPLALAALPLCGAGNRRAVYQALLLLGLFGLTQVLVYGAMQAPVGYYWYFVPGNLGVYALTAAALMELSARFGRLKISSAAAPMGTVAQISGTLALLFFFLLLLSAVPPYRMAQNYRDLSAWLKEHSAPNEWLASAEIGYVGYYSERPIIDMNGLLDQGASAHLKEGRLSWWLETRSPEWVVTHTPRYLGEPIEQFWDKDVYDSFAAQYQPVKDFGPLTLWRRGTRN